MRRWKNIGILFVSILTLALYAVSVQAAGYDQQKAEPQAGAEPGSGEAQMDEAAPQAGVQKWQAPIDQSEAKSILQNYVNAHNDPNIKLGTINEQDKFFEADIQMDGRTLHKARVDKQSGAVSTAR